MKIVVDSNRVIAGLIKESTTRRILFNPYFEFFSPEFLNEEVLKYKKIIIKKANINSDEFEILFSLLIKSITLVDKFNYLNYFKEFNKISDRKDIPYLACCKAINALGVWSHDPHLKEQNKVRVFTNIDMLELLH